MYEAYYNEDPESRQAPIPTVFLPPPGTVDALTELYYVKAHKTELLAKLSMGRVDSIMHKIWLLLREIEEVIRKSNSRRQLLRRIQGATVLRPLAKTPCF